MGDTQVSTPFCVQAPSKPINIKLILIGDGACGKTLSGLMYSEGGKVEETNGKVTFVGEDGKKTEIKLTVGFDFHINAKKKVHIQDIMDSDRPEICALFSFNQYECDTIGKCDAKLLERVRGISIKDSIKSQSKSDGLIQSSTWDFGGQERFELLSSSFKEAKSALLYFDLTNGTTLEHLFAPFEYVLPVIVSVSKAHAPGPVFGLDRKEQYKVLEVHPIDGDALNVREIRSRTLDSWYNRMVNNTGKEFKDTNAKVIFKFGIPAFLVGNKLDVAYEKVQSGENTWPDYSGTFDEMEKKVEDYHLNGAYLTSAKLNWAIPLKEFKDNYLKPDFDVKKIAKPLEYMFFHAIAASFAYQEKVGLMEKHR